METSRVIDGHYLPQRLIRRGQFSTVYQGMDQKLQRVIALKVVPPAYIADYAAAARVTSQFSHPNIVGLYDLIVEPQALYLIEEYVEGVDFASLLQAQLTPYDIIDIGQQICLALIYASSSPRRVCHGDLTPSALIRDHHGRVRVNNFALPADLQYFTAWSAVGGDGIPFAAGDLPAGAESEGRRADDTRAAGLLLYQLLARRSEPPTDGRLRFPRYVPPELCELVARTVIRQHPQRIASAHVLYDELEALEETLEPPAPSLLAQAANPAYQQVPAPQQFSPASAMNPEPLAGHPVNPGHEPSRYIPGNSPHAALEEPVPSDDLTVADPSFRVAPPPAQYALYPPAAPLAPSVPPASTRRSSLPLLLLLGLIVFVLFFIVGYFVGVLLVH